MLTACTWIVASIPVVVVTEETSYAWRRIEWLLLLLLLLMLPVCLRYRAGIRLLLLMLRLLRHLRLMLLLLLLRDTVDNMVSMAVVDV